MPYDEALANQVRAALAGAGSVEEKKMFGGGTFMVGGKMCVNVGRDRIMSRVDTAVHDAAQRRPGSRTVVMKGPEYRGFVHVAADAIKTKDNLDYWMGLALEYNKKSNASGGSRTRRRAQPSNESARYGKWS